MTQLLSELDKMLLLMIARKSIQMEMGIIGHEVIHPPVNSPRLVDNGASFVTLNIHGNLRGCVGSLEAFQPLYLDVKNHAIAAAFHDFRFPPLTEPEITSLIIEISVLSTPVKVSYSTIDDLLDQLVPRVDGVMMEFGSQRATFLPQVWDKLPEKDMFLSRLCHKIGLDQNYWKVNSPNIYVYQVEEFHE